MSSSAREEPLLGIVIPTLDEARHLPALLGDLKQLPLPHRVVVSDGGSGDGTPELARSLGAEVVRAPRGRARQLNAGARALNTPWLLFLHADSRLSPECGPILCEWLATAPRHRVGYFRFALEGEDRFWRFIELGQTIREGLGGLVYGDQGLLVARSLFDAAGGYPDTPLMEDVALVRALRRLGDVTPMDATLRTSPRRYVEEGRWGGWLRNTALMGLYLVGVSPERLARWYRPHRGGAPLDVGSHGRAAGGERSGAAGATGAGEASPRPSREATRRRVLLVFAKNPEPGRVKTRIAREVGEERAAALYRRMARAVVDQVRRGPYRTVIVFDPPEAEDAVRTWLGESDVEYRPQSEGDLGRRLSDAFGWAFQEADEVCVVGTDAPGVDRSTVQEAFESLDRAPVVLGPAEDGGYYLLALDHPSSGLFQGIPWSTDRVLDVTRRRAAELGLGDVLLAPLADVDTVADIPADLM